MKRKTNNAYLEYSHKAHLERVGETENQGIRYSRALRVQVCLDPGDPEHQKGSRSDREESILQLFTFLSVLGPGVSI